MMLLWPLAYLGVIGIAWALICLVAKANNAFGGEKAKSEGSSLGGCITAVIIIGAILLLCYLWGAMGGSYDYHGPIRR